MTRRAGLIGVAALLCAAGCATSPDRPRDELKAILKKQLEHCYILPIQARSEAPVVVEIRLNDEGALAHAPKVVDGDARSRIAAAAVRAVERCTPFRIPADLVKRNPSWRRLRITFDHS